MSAKHILLRLLTLILFLPFLGYAEGKVVLTEVSGVINPIIARYIGNTIARAEK